MNHDECQNCHDLHQTIGQECSVCHVMVTAPVANQNVVQDEPSFLQKNWKLLLALAIIAILGVGLLFAFNSGKIKLPAGTSAPAGGTTGLAACTGDQVLYFMSNAVLDGGTDCTMADGSLLSAKTPNAVVTSPLACTGDQVMYFVTNGSLNAGVDCTLSDGSLLSAFKSPASVTTTLAACTADQVLNFTSNGALAGGVDCTMPDGSLLSTHAPAAVVTTVSACSADQVLNFMSNGALAGGVDCTMPDGSLLSTHAPAAVVTSPLPVGNAGSPVLPTTPLEAGVGFIQLNYDKNPAYKGNCMDNTNLATDALVAGQTSYPAFEICKANAAGDNQVDLETAIAAIQLQAQNAGAKTLVGNTITLPNESAWLVWIPNASTFDASTLPNDVAFPTGLVHPALGQIWIVPAYAAGINGRTFQNADYAFWAVALK